MAWPRIGVLGGMGPAATAEFYRRLVRRTPAATDQDHPHVVIDCDPSVPDRSAAITSAGADPRPAIQKIGDRLVAAGCELLVMPCNTASWFTEPGMFGVPLLAWDRAVTAQLGRHVPRPGAVAVLATDGTVASDLYRTSLADQGISSVYPAPADQTLTMQLIRRLKAGDRPETLRPALFELIDRQSCELTLLACTELSDIAAGHHPPGVLDAMDLALTTLFAVADQWQGISAAKIRHRDVLS